MWVWSPHCDRSVGLITQRLGLDLGLGLWSRTRPQSNSSVLMVKITSAASQQDIFIIQQESLKVSGMRPSIVKPKILLI